jgi:predicted amidohydrolase YtcJ
MRMLRTALAAVFAAGAIGLGAAGRPDVPTQILYNGTVLTMDEAFTTAEAVAIRNDRIYAVGSSKEMLALAGPETTKTDLAGKVVLPGFTDSHFHLVSAALANAEVQLTSARTIDELVGIIAGVAKTTPKGEWIVPSGGWTLGQLKENRLPTREELDRATTEHPVWVPRGGHRGVANSLALKLAGVTKDTKVPEGGVIGRDSRGELDGLIMDKAQSFIDPLLPKPTHEKTVKAVLKMLEELHAAGITSIYDGAAAPEDLRLLQELRDAGQLTMRTAMRIRVPDEKFYDTIKAMPRSGFGDSMLRIGAIKMVVDGGSDGNLFTEPYEGKPDFYGIQITPTETLRKVILQGNLDGWQFSFHCNGDKAFDILLGIMEEANKQKSIVGRRWTIEHGRYPRADQIPRIKALGLWMSTQANPYWLSSVHIENFGLKRAASANPLPTLFKAGIPVAGGSDHGEFFAPLLHMWWYVTRKTRDSGVLGIEHAISPREALLLHTRNPPYLTFEEASKGTIEPDKLADFTVLQDNPLKIPPDGIKDIKVVAAIVGGRIVHGKL